MTNVTAGSVQKHFDARFHCHGVYHNIGFNLVQNQITEGRSTLRVYHAHNNIATVQITPKEHKALVTFDIPRCKTFMQRIKLDPKSTDDRTRFANAVRNSLLTNIKRHLPVNTVNFTAQP